MVTTPWSNSAGQPRILRSFSVVWISLSVGTLVKVAGSESRMEAKRIGRAAFFEPLTCTCPVRGTPPSITSLSIRVLLWIMTLSKLRHPYRIF